MAVIQNNIEDVFRQIQDHELLEKVCFRKQTSTKFFGSKGICVTTGIYLCAHLILVLHFHLLIPHILFTFTAVFSNG